MLAALTVARLREATATNGLDAVKSWLSPDEVEATDLPLAKATEKVLGSMQAILLKTKQARDEELAQVEEEREREPLALEGAPAEEGKKRMRLRMTKAAEVKVVRNLADLRFPEVEWRAEGF